MMFELYPSKTVLVNLEDPEVDRAGSEAWLLARLAIAKSAWRKLPKLEIPESIKIAARRQGIEITEEE